MAHGQDNEKRLSASYPFEGSDAASVFLVPTSIEFLW